jgi:hypothetical protein
MVVMPLACSTRSFFLLGAVLDFLVSFAFFADFSPSIFPLPFLFRFSITG